MKNKRDLKKLALLGITGGIMLSTQVNAGVASNEITMDVNTRGEIVARGCGGDAGPRVRPKGGPKKGTKALFRSHEDDGKKGGSCSGAGGCPGMNESNGEDKADSHGDAPMSESDLMSQLDYKGRQTYQSLDEEGKELARQLAGRSCSGHNECAGLNSCKSDDNACAGKGGCKGQSGCNFKDKNQAVEVAAKKMAEKRANL